LNEERMDIIFGSSTLWISLFQDRFIRGRVRKKKIAAGDDSHTK
jgi:hypothetical protein